MKMFSIFLQTFENALEFFVKFRPKMLPIKISVFIEARAAEPPEAIGFIENFFKKQWKLRIFRTFSKAFRYFLISRSEYSNRINGKFRFIAKNQKI